MARKVTFEIITRAQTKEVQRLNDLLGDIGSTAKNLSKGVALDWLQDEITGATKGLKKLDSALGSTEDKIKRGVGDNAKRAAADIATLESRIRDLSSATSRLDALRNKSLGFPKKLADAEKAYTEALNDSRDARRRLNDVESKGTSATLNEVREASEAYEKASKSSTDARQNLEKLKKEFDDTGREVLQFERRMNELDEAFTELSKTATGRDTLKQLLPKDVANRILQTKDAINSLTQTFDKAFVAPRNSLGMLMTSLSGVTTNVKRLGDQAEGVKHLGEEITKLGKLRSDWLDDAIGSSKKALNDASKAIQQQSEEAIKLRGSYDRLDTSYDRFREGQSQLDDIMRRGTAAIEEQRNAQRLLTAALAGSRSEETTLSKRQEALLAQQRNYTERLNELRGQIDAATTKMMQSEGADYLRAADNVEKLRTAFTQLSDALDANQANLKDNAAALDRAKSQFTAIQAGADSFADTLRTIRTAIDPFKSLVTSIQNTNRVIMQLAQNFGTKLRSAISSAANAARSFVGSAGSIFSGLQRALQSTGNAFRSFADNVANSMKRGKDSMMEMYAAGFSLVMMGQQVQQAGMNMFRNLGRGLQGYMDYERAVIQAGTAAANFDTATPVVPTGLIKDMIFEMQRGSAVPPWLASGKPMPVTFSANELAQGLYYYSSAIGQEITDTNRDEISGIVQTIMQMAKVTNTSVETATKGVLNIAQEFGYDTRDLTAGNAEAISKIAAQVGLLANISTMEVSDIVETFKMVGPMANLLSGGGAGAGLTDTFLMSFLASEIGLRGGNVGRGINQALSSLLDPTEKMLESAGKWFGSGEPLTEDQFKDIFFVAGTDELKGGFQGFLKTLATTDPATQASMLAEMFTTNATRSLLGGMAITGEFAGGMTLEEFTAKMEGDDPFAWLQVAAAEAANSVSGWFTFMTNAWFQFQSSIVGSISGPLMTAFRLIGEVLFEFAERINLDPRIGQTIAAIVTAIASVATVVGTLMIAAGGILLIGRSFAILGGFVLPFIRLLSIASVVFVGLIPIVAAVGVAIGLLAVAFNANFLGIKDGVDAVRHAFNNFDSVILPIIERVFDGLTNLGRAFNEFVTIILAGQTGTAQNLFALMESVFGPLLGGKINNALQVLSMNLESTREKLASFFDARTINADVFRNAALAVQGFFEVLFLGQQRMETAAAADMLGRWLGIDNFQVKMNQAARDFGQFVGNLVGYASIVANAWTSMTSQIWSNLQRIATAGGLISIWQAVGTVAQGALQGIVVAITFVLGAVEKATAAIADFSEALGKAGKSGKTILGFTITFEGALKALGATIGLVLGARLALAFGPFMSVVARILPLMTGLTSVVVGLAGRFVVLAAQIAISVAAWAAELAVATAVLATKGLLAAANAILTASEVSLAGSSIAATGSMSAQAVIVGALSALYGIMTASIVGAFTGLVSLATGESIAAATGMILAASLTAVSAAMAIVAIGAFLVIGAMLALVGILAAVAAGALIMVTATEGLGAGFSALIDLIQGVWAGMQFGLAVVGTFVDVIMSLVGALGNLVGVGNEFQMLGILIGAAIGVILVAVVALIASLAVLAISMAATWVVGLGPIALIVAGIGLLVAAILVAMTYWDDFKNKVNEVIDTVTQAWNDMVLGFQAVFARMIDAVTGAFADGVNKIIDGINHAKSVLGDVVGFDTSDWTKISGTSVYGNESDPNSIAGRVAARRAELSGPQGSDGWVAPEDYDEPDYTKVAEKYKSGLMNALAKVGLDDEFSNLMEGLNIDPDHLNFSDLSGLLNETFNGPDGVAAASQIDWSFLGPRGSEYSQALTAWEDYQRRIKDYQEQFGVTADKAKDAVDKMYVAMGMPIPTGAPNIADYIGDQAAGANEGADALAEAAAKIGLSVDDIYNAFNSLKGMSTADYLSAVYDPLAGQGGQSVAGWLANGGAGQIVENAGDNAPWLNDMEVIADAAGTGAAMGANIYGKNVHEVLKPYMQVLAKQTGMSVEELLANIPKFVAPDELMGIAGGDLAIGIAENLDKSMYEAIDLLGAGEYTEWGLDWAELQAYAAGKAASGIDWDLADYISESWGMSIDEANNYLRSHGIDPNAISDSWFEATEAAALTGNGAYSAMTEEMYTYLSDATNGFTSKVITMTRDEWAKIPPAYKAVMANLGITTIIADEFLPPETLSQIGAKTREFTDFIIQQGEIIAAGTTEGLQGTADQWTELSRDIDEATGEVMVVLQDLDGTQVRIPAAEYDAYLASIEKIKEGSLSAEEYLKRASDAAKRYAEDVKNTGSGLDTPEGRRNWVQGARDYWAGSQMQGGGQPPSDLGKALGLPDHMDIKINLDTTAVDTVKKTFTDLTGEEGVKVKITPDAAAFTTVMTGLITSYNTSQTLVKIRVEPDASAFTTMMTGLITAYNTDQTLVKIKVTPDSEAFGTEMSNILNAYSIDESLVKIKVGADNTAFVEDVTNLLVAYGTDTSLVTIKVDADITPFALTMDGAINPETGSWGAVTIKVDADLTDFATTMDEAVNPETGSWGTATVKVSADPTQFALDMNSLVNPETGTWGSVTIQVTADVQPIATAISGVALAYAGVPIVKVSIGADAALFDTAMATANTSLDNFDARTAISSLNVDSALFDVGMINANSSLDTFDARTAVASIDLDASKFFITIGSAFDMLNAFGNTSKTASVYLSDNASGPLQNIINLFNSIPTSKTSSIYVNTYATTYSATAAEGGFKAGGKVTLVGEEGPELVVFPSNAYVFTADETAKLQRTAVGGLMSAASATFGAAGADAAATATGNVYRPNDSISRDYKDFLDKFERQTVAAVESGASDVAYKVGRVFPKNDIARGVSVAAPPSAFTPYDTSLIQHQTVMGNATSNPFTDGSTTNNTKNSSIFVAQSQPAQHVNIENINITTPQAADRFFEEMDRRTGRRTDLARRGMTSFTDENLW